MKPDKPLKNLDRIQILSDWTGISKERLSDLERVHFGTNRTTEMRYIMRSVLTETANNFQEIYDDYLLYLWDQLNAPAATGGTGTPIGLLLALTREA